MAETAASLAFYSVFSLFPLLGLLVGITSYIIPQDRVGSLLLDVLASILPVSIDLISANIQRFLHLRGTISLVGIIGLAWAASNVFTIIVHHINQAWEEAHVRTFLQKRLIALAMITVIVVLFGILWLVTAILDFLTKQGIYIFGAGSIVFSPIWKLLSLGASPVIAFLIFFILYRWVPNTRVRSSEAAWGALVVTAVWEITAGAYSWYIGSGLSAYNLLYGSLATLAVLMLWFYINSLILLYGAYLCASIARWRAKPTLTPTPG